MTSKFTKKWLTKKTAEIPDWYLDDEPKKTKCHVRKTTKRHVRKTKLKLVVDNTAS